MTLYFNHVFFTILFYCTVKKSKSYCDCIFITVQYYYFDIFRLACESLAEVLGMSEKNRTSLQSKMFSDDIRQRFLLEETGSNVKSTQESISYDPGTLFLCVWCVKNSKQNV